MKKVEFAFTMIYENTCHEDYVMVKDNATECEIEDAITDQIFNWVEAYWRKEDE